ncbi:MFS multidrug transporter [Lasiodiplodia theobromae]|uniref:MFS multidrug transporter n=1 Tax=Lasiodiplodia theobromae TaxID=45133 RepID=UPI0015C3FC95|nr:MFS multidrug transporter [Lasiodiplodia theobromae]KAF4540797.1 MFS multidrug transporter [Lasiodiplodia theobromae]
MTAHRAANGHNGHPTERSPLLGQRRTSDGLQVLAPQPVGDGPEDDYEGDNGGGFEDDGGDLERQESNISEAGTTLNKYKGLPEVKKRMKYILPAVAVGIFLSAADQTIIVSSYGRIGSDLGALNNTSWIATAYFLTLTSFQPLYGKLSDIFGRKSCLLFAYTIFGIGCLACGLARNMNELIAARAFAGVGGGGMTTVVSIMMSDIVTLRERGKWQGYINIVFATGAGTGAPLGGILADRVGWRWVFLFQPPLCVVAIIAVSLALKLPKRDHSHWKEKLRRIDFLGAVILIAAVFMLLLGLDRGSNVSWRDRTTLASLGASVPLFLLFLLVETKVASDPFAPGHIIFERSLVACYACNFFSFGGYMAALFYLPLYFQVVDGASATQAGVRLIPGIIAGVTGSLFGGFYMQWTGRFYRLTVAAYAGLVVGAAVIFVCAGGGARLLPPQFAPVNSTLGIVLGLCVSGFSNGIGVTTSLIGLISNAAHADQAVATACSYLFRSLGSVFGVSLAATLVNQELRARLAAALGSGAEAAAIAERVRQSIESIWELPPAVAEVVRRCYAESTRSAFGLMIALVAGAAVGAWFVRERRLGGK